LRRPISRCGNTMGFYHLPRPEDWFFDRNATAGAAGGDYRRVISVVPYINPLKHGLVVRVRAWTHSSFHRDVRGKRITRMRHIAAINQHTCGCQPSSIIDFQCRRSGQMMME
jgi:hypothetical protein